MEHNFGYEEEINTIDNSAPVTTPPVNATNLDTGKVESTEGKDVVTDLEDKDKKPSSASVDTNVKNAINVTTKEKDTSKESADDKSADTKHEEGTIFETDNGTYTVDKDGNVIDNKGSIFKTADEVDEWIKSFDAAEESETADKELSIDNIKKVVGIELTDDNDKPIEFENSIEGVQQYINSILESNRDEVAMATIDAFYSKFPIMEQLLNYYVANGNSIEGFNEIPDRSNITLDANNEAQNEAIIRTSWKEQGKKGDVDTYIQYLKSQNMLHDVAKEELEGLQQKDKEAQEQLAIRAKEEEDKAIALQTEYWNGVKETINNKKIGEYKIPDTIVINKNGKKTSATPNDFFNYVYQVDSKGMSAYERDLAAQNPKDRMNNELLSAYLTFNGGDYSSLVKMAINEEKVKTIKLKHIEKPTTKGKMIIKPSNTKEIDLGF